MKLFQKQNTANQPQLTPREKEEQKYQAARSNLLLMLAFTAINVVLTIANSGYYFLFSASVPFFFAQLAVAGWGYDTALLVESVVILVAVMALYLVSYLLSKKRPGWMIVALVLFALDTAFLTIELVLWQYFDLLEVLFHIWILYYLIRGVSAIGKLKQMPPEEVPAPVPAVQPYAAVAAMNAEAVESAEKPEPVTETRESSWLAEERAREQKNDGQN